MPEALSDVKNDVMSFLSARLGEATTGAAIASICGTVTAMANGSMTWQTALPVLVGAIIAIFYPETKPNA